MEEEDSYDTFDPIGPLRDHHPPPLYTPPTLEPPLFPPTDAFGQVPAPAAFIPAPYAAYAAPQSPLPKSTASTTDGSSPTQSYCSAPFPPIPEQSAHVMGYPVGGAGGGGAVSASAPVSASCASGARKGGGGCGGGGGGQKRKADGPVDCSHLDKKEQQRLRNRISAQQSRDRKKKEFEGLSLQVDTLTTENADLRRENVALRAENTAIAAHRDQLVSENNTLRSRLSHWEAQYTDLPPPPSLPPLTPQGIDEDMPVCGGPPSLDSPSDGPSDSASLWDGWWGSTSTGGSPSSDRSSASGARFYGWIGVLGVLIFGICLVSLTGVLTPMGPSYSFTSAPMTRYTPGRLPWSNNGRVLMSLPEPPNQKELIVYNPDGHAVQLWQQTGAAKGDPAVNVIGGASGGGGPVHDTREEAEELVRRLMLESQAGEGAGEQEQGDGHDEPSHMPYRLVCVNPHFVIGDHNLHALLTDGGKPAAPPALPTPAAPSPPTHTSTSTQQEPTVEDTETTETTTHTAANTTHPLRLRGTNATRDHETMLDMLAQNSVLKHLVPNSSNIKNKEGASLTSSKQCGPQPRERGNDTRGRDRVVVVANGDGSDPSNTVQVYGAPRKRTHSGPVNFIVTFPGDVLTSAGLRHVDERGNVAMLAPMEPMHLACSYLVKQNGD